MDGSGIYAALILVAIMLISLYLFFEVFGFTPAASGGATSAH